MRFTISVSNFVSEWVMNDSKSKRLSNLTAYQKLLLLVEYSMTKNFPETLCFRKELTV